MNNSNINFNNINSNLNNISNTEDLKDMIEKIIIMSQKLNEKRKNILESINDIVSQKTTATNDQINPIITNIKNLIERIEIYNIKVKDYNLKLQEKINLQRLQNDNENDISKPFNTFKKNMENFINEETSTATENESSQNDQNKSIRALKEQFLKKLGEYANSKQETGKSTLSKEELKTLETELKKFYQDSIQKIKNSESQTNNSKQFIIIEIIEELEEKLQKKQNTSPAPESKVGVVTTPTSEIPELDQKNFSGTEIQQINIFIEKLNNLLEIKSNDKYSNDKDNISKYVEDIITNFNNNKGTDIVKIIESKDINVVVKNINQQFPIIAIHKNISQEEIESLEKNYDFLFYLKGISKTITNKYDNNYKGDDNIWLIGIFKLNIVNLEEKINIKKDIDSNLLTNVVTKGNLDKFFKKDKKYFKKVEEDNKKNLNLITNEDIKEQINKEGQKGSGYYNYSLYGGQYAGQYYYPPRQIKQPLHNFIVPLMVFKMYRIILYKKLLKSEQKFLFQNIFIDIVSSFMLIIVLFTLGLKKVASLLFTDLLSSVVVIYLFLFAYDDYVKDKSKVNVQYIINVLILIPYFVMYL